MSVPKIKVSQMSVAGTINATDILMIVQDGVNKKVPISTLLNNLNSANSIRINPLQFAVDITIASKNDANAIVIKGSSDKIGFGINLPESKVHVNGNLQVGSLTADGVILESTDDMGYTALDQTNVVTKQISTSRSGTTLSCDSGVSGKFSLPNGNNGQIKVITAAVLGAGKNITIAVNGNGFTNITCLLAGNTVTLKYFTSITKWCVVGLYGATVA